MTILIGATVILTLISLTDMIISIVNKRSIDKLLIMHDSKYVSDVAKILKDRYDEGCPDCSLPVVSTMSDRQFYQCGSSDNYGRLDSFIKGLNCDDEVQ